MLTAVLISSVGFLSDVLHLSALISVLSAQCIPALLRHPKMASDFRLTILLVALTSLPPLGAHAAEPVVQFARDVRPLLASKCFACHGPDEGTREAGLRLDAATSAFQPADSGQPAILPGRAEDSQLIHRVTSSDNSTRMPPDDRLSDEEIRLLRNWIDQGAKYQQHWAFEPPVRSPIPKVQATHWPRSAIDYFVISELESTGLAPAPAADRPTLIRRLYLDLLGFLPSISAVQTFTEDQDPLAYERLVGELLASPHFGERWGRYWLDLARYGDSDGYLDDRLRPNAWIYRDWVINAINRDLPFDQFTIEQLAGDLLPNAKLEQRIATGFHRNTLHNTEAGVDREEYRVKEVVDRVSTTGVVWLGLTLGCAECHSHKYDPITQLEFFNLYAIFNNAQETDLPASLAREQVAHALALQQWQQEHSRLSAELELLAETFDQRQSTWQAELRAQYASTPSHTEVAWQPLTELHLLASSADSSSQLAIDGQGFIEVTGTEADVDTYRLQFALPSGVTRVAALRLELLPGTATDEPLPEPIGRNSAGRFVLSELRVGTQIRQDSNEKIVTIDGNASDSNVSSSPQIIWREWDTALATIQPSGYEVTQAIDGNKTTGWSSLDRVMGRQTALFNFEQPIDIDPTDASTQLVIELEHAIKQAGSLRRFRLSLHPQLQSTADALPQDVVRLLKLPEEQLTESERVKLSAFFVASDSVQIAKQEALFKHVLRTPRLPSTKAAVFSELSTPRVTHVHVRGDYKRPGPLAAPQLIHSLFSGDSSGKQADRLDLAQWLVDPNNPLTARVTVNTWWSRLFGRGIVATPDDFGARGSPPSHAELLDWLALELVRSGWSRKHLIRQIVTSSTYRQSSRNNDLLQSIDPMNILLGRQNRLRLEAEIIRDITLQAGGLLHSEIGGPSILPPLPAYITGISRNREWPLSPLAERHKRGMYILLRRATPYPMLTTFDAPDSSLTCAVRERSNTPLQSLTLLNDGVFFSCAQGLGARLATECDEMDASLHLACQVCLGRAATPDELQRLRRLVVEFQELLSDDPTAASQIVGSSQPTTVFSLRDQAALVLLSRVMLNLDSFFCRE